MLSSSYQGKTEDFSLVRKGNENYMITILIKTLYKYIDFV